MLKRKDQEEFWFDAKICQIAYPADLSDYNDIINVCHRFSLYGPDSQQYFMGSDIIKSRDFEIQNHIEEILDRAIKGDNLQMYYQPIFDVKDGKFHSAEALARLIDKKYGVISPLTFITAAERTGMIIPLGNAIIEKVFRFISENDLNRFGI
jgi:predicted signal transduction protein with EAL and GGDEF domain